MWSGLASVLKVVGLWMLGQTAAKFGLGVLSFVGWIAILNQGKEYINMALAGLPADVMAIITMSGAGEGMTWVIAAITTRATIAAFPKLGVLAPT
jgi:hypothetical protein